MSKYLSNEEIREIDPALVGSPQWVMDCQCAHCKKRDEQLRIIADYAADHALEAESKSS
jgi:hypothetical protein